MKVLSIDLGASSGRCMVVDYLNGDLTYEEIHRFKNDIIKIDGFLRWDINKIIFNIKEGIEKSFKKYPEIESIGVDTWGVDYCLLNRDGELIEYPISYRDDHTLNIFEEVSKILSFKTIYSINGLQYLHFNTIYQLFYMYQYRNLIATKAHCFLMIPDYIAYVLTGETRLEITNASTTGLINHKTKLLDNFLISELGIKKSIFPKIIYPGEKYGYLKKEFLPNLNKNVPVTAVCSHDTASAILGTSLSKSSIYISSGTWSLLGVELENSLVNDETLNSGFTNELGYKSSVDFLKNISGMFIVNQVLKDWELYDEKINVESIPRMINDCAEYIGYIDVDDELFLTPNNMTLKIKKYLDKTNQFHPVFKGQMLNLIYISMAAKYKFYIDKLSKLIGKNINEIVICGGGNKADILNQYIANFTNLKVVQGPNEATVLGNAVSQLISLNEIENEIVARQIINKRYKGKLYMPQDVDIFKHKYNEYLKITKLVEEINE